MLDFEIGATGRVRAAAREEAMSKVRSSPSRGIDLGLLLAWVGVAARPASASSPGDFLDRASALRVDDRIEVDDEIAEGRRLSRRQL